MKRFARLVGGVLILLGTAACGKPNYIEQTKNAHLPQCPRHSLGTIVNDYFGTTSWVAYRTGNDDLVRVTASGQILYAGAYTDAELEFLYQASTREVSLLTLRFNDQEQLQPFAEALIDNMCEKARNKD